MRKTIAILLLPVLLLACNTQKQFDRIIKKHPEYLTKYADTFVFTHRDTIEEVDTFVIKGDTISVPSYILQRDTVFTKGRVTLISKNGWVSAHTKTDTFLQRDTLRIEVKSKWVAFKVKEPLNIWFLGAAILFFVLLILALIQRFKVRLLTF